jgi:energy-converting hydrogenase B subunit D
MNVMLVLQVILAVMLVVAALMAIKYKDLVAAVIASSVVSLILSIFFYILQAPDVALTEAAIGVALTTVIFMIAIRKTKRFEE